MSRIKQLPLEVINKIAAGEVVHRPANAIKELLENSIDAKSSVINITVADGGLTEIQITDNGTGIDPKSLPILAKRHTTSKITSVEDLTTVDTFGFRGEALASLSYVCKPLTIMSRVQTERVGFLCKYEQEEMKSKKVQTGKVGTSVAAENIFYN